MGLSQAKQLLTQTNSKDPASITSFSILEFTSNNMKHNHVGPHDLRGITQEISVPQTNKSATSAVITNSVKNEEENTSQSDYKAPHT